MDTYSSDAWRRLGRLLERRRGELGYGFRQRAMFARDGGGRLSVKTISRLENGERVSYPESTIGAVEALYHWVPGSVESVLRGGEPSPPSIAPPRGREPITVRYSPTTQGERLAAWVYVRMRERGCTEEDVHQFLHDEGLPLEPTSIAAVGRIAEVTGASLVEVLALLGVGDIDSRRLRSVSDEPIGRPADEVLDLSPRTRSGSPLGLADAAGTTAVQRSASL